MLIVDGCGAKKKNLSPIKKCRLHGDANGVFVGTPVPLF
jgi:hypothetical protein